jgi:hypothetical protein
VEALPLTLFSSLLVADLVISSEGWFLSVSNFQFDFLFLDSFAYPFSVIGLLAVIASSADTMSCKYEEECADRCCISTGLKLIFI